MTQATRKSVSLAWSRSARGEPVAEYALTVNGSPAAVSKGYAAKVDGLACGTSYLVRVDAIAQSGVRSTVSSAVVATTPCLDQQAPTAPRGIVQVVAGEDSATIAWLHSTDDVGVAGYGLLFQGVLVGTVQSTTYTFGGLACGTSYGVAVYAYDAAGNSSDATPFVIATSACPVDTPPTAPTNVSATAVTQTTIALSWSPSTDDRRVAGYEAYVDGRPVGSTSGTSFTFSGLLCSTTYTLSLDAFDDAGNRSPLVSRSAATAPCATPPPTGGDTHPPTVPTGLAGAGATATTVALAWSASTDDFGVAGYGLYLNGASVGSTPNRTFTFQGLSCGKSYTVGVDAFDAAGNRSATATTIAGTSPCIETQPPTAPTGLTQVARTSTSIGLSWTASTDNTGVAGYALYVNGARIGTTTGTTYTFTGLACGTSYTLGVDAFDAAGNRSTTSAVLMTTGPCGDTQAPTAPAQLVVSGVTDTGAAVAWHLSSDNVGVAGYGLYVNGTLAGTTQQSSYTFSGLTCGTGYTLGVDAYDAAGNRSTRSTASATTTACPSGGGGSSGATVFISPSGNDSGTCTQAAPCQTFDRAYRLVQSGGIVQVAGGLYPETDPAAGTIRINADPTKTSSDDVVFRCTSDVTFDAENFTLLAKHITFEGSCFHFRKVWTGQPGDTGPDSDDLTFSGVKLAGFQIIGSTNITIRNSEIGPNVACYANGDTSKASSSWCQNNTSTGEDWYYRRGKCNCGIEESKIQANEGGYGSSNIVLEGNWFHDQQTRASDTNVGSSSALHMGGLLIEQSCACPVAIRANKWERNVTYDIQGDPSPSGVTVENNWFGAPTNTLDQGATRVSGFKAIDLTLRSGSLSNWLIRFNSIETGIRIDSGTYSNVRVIANIWGAGDCPGGSGLKVEFNVVVGGLCGLSSLSLSSLPFVSLGSSIDFHLTGGPAIDWVTTSDDDAQLGVDYDGDTRPQGAARDAGADEAR